jgi:hypothetical protein
MLDTHTAIAEANSLCDPTSRIGALTDLMAAVMVEQTASDGSCTESDLLGAGFTSAEIIELSCEAKKTAAGQATRMVHPDTAVNGLLETYAAFQELVACAKEAGWADEPGYAIALKRASNGLTALQLIFDIGE